MADLDVLVDDLEGIAGDIAGTPHPSKVAEALAHAVEGARDNDPHRTVLWLLVAQKLT